MIFLFSALFCLIAAKSIKYRDVKLVFYPRLTLLLMVASQSIANQFEIIQTWAFCIHLR